MVVIFENAPEISLAEHLFVIQFGGEQGIRLNVEQPMALGTNFRSYATELHVPEELPRSIRALVETDLVPELHMAQDGNPYMHFAFLMNGGQRAPQANIPPNTEPFLLDGDGKPFAGRITRGDGVEYWWIPFKAKEIEAWIVTAINEWRKVKPESFPSDPEWTRAPAWQTPAERSLRLEALQVAEERLGYIRDSELKERELLGRLESTSLQADQAERLLLTAQGDELVSEVVKSLEVLGFDALMPDLDPARRGDRLEDIQVRDREEEGWIALVEVRGYKDGGAKVNDLLRIGRFVSRFAASQKTLPTRAWYIINQSFAQDPALRPRPLASNPVEVSTFADGGGLIIDTRDIFRLRICVLDGSIDKASARKMLRDQTGVFVFNESKAAQS